MSAKHSDPTEVRSGLDDGQPTIGMLIHQAEQSFSTILHGEIELAKIEIKSAVKFAGTGAGAFIAALVILVFSMTFGLIALAEGLVALHIWRWASYLIVFGFLVFLALSLVFLGIRKVKRVRPPKDTIDTTKETVAVLKQAASSS